jgi:hypothetical protein
MTKVTWSEAAITEILPYFGYASEWYVLLSKMSSKTKRIKDKWKKHIFSTIITSRKRYLAAIQSSLMLRHLLKKWADMLMLYNINLKLLARISAMRDSKEILRILKKKENYNINKIILYKRPDRNLSEFVNSYDWIDERICSWKNYESIRKELIQMKLESKITEKSLCLNNILSTVHLYLYPNFI